MAHHIKRHRPAVRVAGFAGPIAKGIADRGAPRARVRLGCQGLLVLLLFACGPTPEHAPASARPTNTSAVENRANEPSCPFDEIPLTADGVLRCRELPVEVAFPSGTTKVVRIGNGVTMAFEPPPKPEPREADTWGSDPKPSSFESSMFRVVVTAGTSTEPQLLNQLNLTARFIASDARTAPAAQPPLVAGATAAAEIAFTTPDGGAGVIRGYVIHGFVIELVVGSRSADSPSRPDKPLARQFLASLQPRSLATGKKRIELPGGGAFVVPANAWVMTMDTKVATTGITYAMFIPAHRLLTAHVFDLKRPCTSVDRQQFTGSNSDNMEKSHYGDLSYYREDETPDKMPMATYIICAKTTLALISLAPYDRDATPPLFSELRRDLEPIAASLTVK
jgi:hypothetical protein